MKGIVRPLGIAALAGAAVGIAPAQPVIFTALNSASSSALRRVAGTALACRTIASVVEEDGARDLCRNSKEVRTISPSCTRLIYRPQAGLFEQCRSLERVPRPFPPHVPVSNLAQFAVDQRQQIL